jgi:hypothetical protein
MRATVATTKKLMVPSYAKMGDFLREAQLSRKLKGGASRI